jgi:hypothetical protein
MAGETIDIPNVPATLPLEFRLGVNQAVGPYSPGEYDAKHEPGNVKVRFVTFK